MARVDLDKAWELTPGCAGDFDVDGCELMRAVIAELRAAREVVKAAQWIERTGALPPSNEVAARRLSDLEQAVRAYDKAVSDG